MVVDGIEVLTADEALAFGSRVPSRVHRSDCGIGRGLRHGAGFRSG